MCLWHTWRLLMGAGHARVACAQVHAFREDGGTFDYEYQEALFPHLKPVSFSVGDDIFKKGELSKELLFLIKVRA